MPRNIFESPRVSAVGAWALLRDGAPCGRVIFDNTTGRSTCFIGYTDESGEYHTGTGSAGGYGYHRPSAAFEEARRAAGMPEPATALDGRGDGAVREYLAACGFTPVVVLD